MKTRMVRKIAVLVTGSALALSFPVAGAVANSGGVPNHGAKKEKKKKKEKKGCPSQAQGWGTSNSNPNAENNGNGQKCGFVFGGKLTSS